MRRMRAGAGRKTALVTLQCEGFRPVERGEITFG